MDGFHQYNLQMNQFGKFKCKELYIDFYDNNYITKKFGIYADNKLYSYVLWKTFLKGLDTSDKNVSFCILKDKGILSNHE